MTTGPIEQAREDIASVLAGRVLCADDGDWTQQGADEAEAWPVFEQAILRYHPDVVRLVEAARRIEHQSLSCDTIEGVAYCFCILKGLTAALVPFTTEEESE